MGQKILRSSMGTHIIVDGYNLIGVKAGLRGDIESKRRELIDLLARYKDTKGYSITVVFDGWQGGQAREERDRINGIDIIYSRRGEKADEVIKRLIQQKGSCIVVSSDREVAGFADVRGGTAITSGVFHKKIEEAIRPKDKKGPAYFNENEKEEAEEEEKITTRKKGNPRRPSKLERKKRLIFNKL